MSSGELQETFAVSLVIMYKGPPKELSPGEPSRTQDKGLQAPELADVFRAHAEANPEDGHTDESTTDGGHVGFHEGFRGSDGVSDGVCVGQTGSRESGSDESQEGDVAAFDGVSDVFHVYLLLLVVVMSTLQTLCCILDTLTIAHMNSNASFLYCVYIVIRVARSAFLNGPCGIFVMG